ncbi:hypothetical protein JNUCC1_03326 [Lentibacillus sp. JNUCC-1]|nr:hypothetical protein [Lentibacillus sp. JNUCC-1]
MKLYIVIKTHKTADGDVLQTVLTYKSKPKRFDYIVFI